jgi:hypothetical protein
MITVQAEVQRKNYLVNIAGAPTACLDTEIGDCTVVPTVQAPTQAGTQLQDCLHKLARRCEGVTI